MISIIPDMKRRTVDAFVKKAGENDAAPSGAGSETRCSLVSCSQRTQSGNGVVSAREDIRRQWRKSFFGKGDSICLDFGDHHVGLC